MESGIDDMLINPSRNRTFFFLLSRSIMSLFISGALPPYFRGPKLHKEGLHEDMLSCERTALSYLTQVKI